MEFSYYLESPMCIIKNGKAVSENKHDDYKKEGRCFAWRVIYSVHSGGKGQCCHSMI